MLLSRLIFSFIQLIVFSANWIDRKPVCSGCLRRRFASHPSRLNQFMPMRKKRQLELNVFKSVSLPDSSHSPEFCYVLPCFLPLFSEAINLFFVKLPNVGLASWSASCSRCLIPSFTLSCCHACKPLSQTPPWHTHTAFIIYKPKMEE